MSDPIKHAPAEYTRPVNSVLTHSFESMRRGWRGVQLEAQAWEYYLVGEEQEGDQQATFRALQLAVNAMAPDQIVVVSAPTDVLVTGTPHDFVTHYRNVQVGEAQAP